MHYASEPYVGKRTATLEELREITDQQRDAAKLADASSHDCCEVL